MSIREVVDVLTAGRDMILDAIVEAEICLSRSVTGRFQSILCFGQADGQTHSLVAYKVYRSVECRRSNADLRPREA